jgi:hypothetical protein
MLFLFTFPAHLAALALGLWLIGPLTRRRPAPWSSALLALGVAAMAAITLYLSDPPVLFSDLAIAYHPAGHAVLHDPAALAALMKKGVNGFVNLPAVAWVFAPLALAPLAAAGWAFAGLGLAAIAGAWALLCRAFRLETADRWRLALLLAANGPLAYSLKEGNTSHFVLFGLAAALVLIRGGRSGWAGAALAAAALLKPPLVLFGGFFLLRRDLRGVAGFGLTTLGAAALSLALFGWAMNLHWFEICILGSTQKWLAAFNVQSFAAFLVRLGAPARGLLSWDGILPSPGLQTLSRAWLALLLAAAAAAWFAGAARRGDAERRDARYVLVLTVALIASPLTWTHYYCWLLLAAALFLAERRDRPAGEQALGWTAIFLVSPIARILPIAGGPALAVYKDFAVSHFLLGGVLWFALLAWRLVRPVPHAAEQMTMRRARPTGTLPATRLPIGEPPLGT